HPWWTILKSADPAHLAIDTDAEACTYEKLFTLIDQWRAHLAAYNPKRVAIAFPSPRDKTADVYSLIWACFFSGKSVTLFSPELLQHRFADELNHRLKQLSLEGVWSTSPSLPPLTTPPTEPCDEDEVWTVFSSGTSGASPSPVSISWRAVKAFAANLQKTFPVKKEARLSQIYGLQFDPSFADILRAGLFGATLVPFTGQTRVLDFINKKKISHLSLTPSHLHLELKTALSDTAFNLSETIFTGEALPRSLVKQWRTLAPKSVIHNLYGPVQTAVWISHFTLPINEYPPAHATLPIGHVFSDHKVKIKKDGILHIQGPQTNGAWYNTGDRVEVTNNGLVWKGRADSVIKIRGELLHLEDFETALKEHLQLDSLQVSPFDHGLQLALAVPPGIPATEILTEKLATWPHEKTRRILPKKIIQLPFWPLSLNGKTDRPRIDRMVSDHINESGFLKQLAGRIDASPERSILAHDKSTLNQRVHSCRALLRALSPSGLLFYSVKTNPLPNILSALADQIDGFDVSSESEHQLAALLAPRTLITASGPAKTDEWLNTISHSPIHRIHVDNIDEYRSLAQNHTSYMTLRLHIPSRGAPKLGLTAPEITQLLKENRFHGFHAYMGRESFSLTALLDVIERAGAFFANFPASFSCREITVGLGLPGFFQSSSFCENDIKLAHIIRETLAKLDTVLHFEIGRGIAQASGLYSVPIIAIKNIEGKNIALVNGGFQHIAANLTSPIHGNKGLEVYAYRPNVGFLTESKMCVEIFGSLGIGHDRLIHDISLPSTIQRGDHIIFSSAGAYNTTAASAWFIGAAPPLQFWRDENSIWHTVPALPRYLSKDLS
ncbi:MAG: AMP-binding protein, partial [Bdellovibrionales bacterium]|nr:AMP-binding protein [Bdellovibrionales bacterium]